MILHSKLMTFPKYQHKGSGLFMLVCIDPMQECVALDISVVFTQAPLKQSRSPGLIMTPRVEYKPEQMASQARQQVLRGAEKKQSRYYFLISDCS